MAQPQMSQVNPTVKAQQSAPKNWTAHFAAHRSFDFGGFKHEVIPDVWSRGVNWVLNATYRFTVQIN